MKKINSSLGVNDYHILKREVMYSGVFELIRYEISCKTFAGTMSSPFKREVLERTSAGAVLPYDPHLDQVVLIEQFRVGALRDKTSPWLLEIVAGIYDHDETPEVLIRREAEEEAGCKILDIYPIYEYFVSPGGSNEFIQIFCGKIDARHAGGIYGLLDENENIKAYAVPFTEALNLLKEGQIKTAPAIIALQWLQLNRGWLRELWQK